MDWQLPDIRKTIKYNILSITLSSHTVSIGRFRQYIDTDRLKLVVSVNFHICSKYVGWILDWQ